MIEEQLAKNLYYDGQFGTDAAKLLPGEYYVTTQPMVLVTVLGSCVAACIRDVQLGIGGMNHFMLPESVHEPDSPLSSSARYGTYAMELLINELIKRGASRTTLEAKVFGGGAVISGMTTINIGERNTQFVLDYLKTERIAVVSKDVLDVYPRKVCFLPASGKAMVKRLAPSNAEALAAQDRVAAQKAAPQVTGGGSIDLF